jgi:hypothetical protein
MLSFPIVGLKISSLPTFAWKSPNRIFMSYLGRKLYQFKNFNIILIYETILFVREKGNCKTNDKSTLPQYKIHIELPSVGTQSWNLHCRPTVAGGGFYNRLPAHINLIKDNLLFRRQLKQLLIKGCYYSFEEYMCVMTARNTHYQYFSVISIVIFSVVYIFIYLY